MVGQLQDSCPQHKCIPKLAAFSFGRGTVGQAGEGEGGRLFFTLVLC